METTQQTLQGADGIDDGNGGRGGLEQTGTGPDWWRRLDAHLQDMWNGARRGEQENVTRHAIDIRHMINAALHAAEPPGPDAPVLAPIHVGGLPCAAEVRYLLRTAYEREPAGPTSYAIGCALQTIDNLTACAGLHDLSRDLGEVVHFAQAAYRTGGIPADQIFTALPREEGMGEATYVASALGHHIPPWPRPAQGWQHRPVKLVYESAPCGLRPAPVRAAGTTP